MFRTRAGAFCISRTYANREAEAAAAKAKEASLREQGEYKTLAEQRAERIAELEAETGKVETLTTRLDEAEAVISDLVQAGLKDAPEYVVELLDGKTPVEQLRYLNKHRENWTKAVPMGARETRKPANVTPEMAREELKNKYLEQAGFRPR